MTNTSALGMLGVGVVGGGLVIAGNLLLGGWSLGLLAIFMAAIVGSFVWSARRMDKLAVTTNFHLPVSEENALEEAQRQSDFFHEVLHHSKKSPEAQEIARNGVELMENYEEVLQAWALLTWQEKNNAAAQELQSAARELQESILSHHTTLKELLRWEDEASQRAVVLADPEVALRARLVTTQHQENLQRTQETLRHQKDAYNDLANSVSSLQGTSASKAGPLAE